ncbi:hypothetical protein C9I98_05715 [Photobacterium sanctipauli]|uniref:Uncharacterized protein n=1 Tax=Photobacterium sanctipauli TaxID=1342794 RepID=A0A2T3NYY9_9GAMM|nr:hypothetical protein [Photobacterium sanctipauli]PSW21429.1 hypothetical protein C9I98_05715 [Photobacterium sanctipauli]
MTIDDMYTYLDRGQREKVDNLTGEARVRLIEQTYQRQRQRECDRELHRQREFIRYQNCDGMAYQEAVEVTRSRQANALAKGLKARAKPQESTQTTLKASLSPTDQRFNNMLIAKQSLLHAYQRQGVL